MKKILKTIARNLLRQLLLDLLIEFNKEVARKNYDDNKSNINFQEDFNKINLGTFVEKFIGNL